MEKSNSFQFSDNKLNHRLLALLRKSKIKHEVDESGIIHYSPDADEVVEYDLICSIRDKVFPSWQLLTCPPAWVERYKRYMRNHGIPFYEELSNGEAWFLLPRRHRPHRWKLEGSRRTEVVP